MKDKQRGDFLALFTELKEDPDLFFRYIRMDIDTFYEPTWCNLTYIKKVLENRFAQNSSFHT